MRAAWIGIFLVLAVSFTADCKPTKETKEKIPQTEEELLNLIRNHMRNSMTPFKGRPFTAKQQAWFDSLAVRTPQLENKQNVKIRKEIRQLSDEEWSAYIAGVYALNSLYPDPADDRTQWQLFTEAHNSLASPAAHQGSAFVVWHREFVWRLERALQMQNPDLTVPFWDTTLDYHLPDPMDTVYFSEHLLGNPNGQVVTGPFANFQTLKSCTENTEFTAIFRDADRNPLDLRKLLFFTEEKIEESLSSNTYGNFSHLGAVFEAHHGGPHMFVGGLFGTSVPCSPSDPIFFTHHSFIDMVFQLFRENSQTTDLETDYPTPDEIDVGGELHEAYADMAPFPGVYNIHGLSTHYTDYYYNYAKRHYTTCQTTADCTSKYLWCDVTNARCVSKIREGGVCTGLTDESCYGDDYSCVNDVCSQAEKKTNKV